MTFDYHFFDFFEYMQVWCTFGIKMLIFLSICSFCAVGSQNHTFLASHAGFGEVQVTKPGEGMQF